MERNQFNIDRLLRSKLSRPSPGPDEAARSLMAQMLRDAAKEKKRKKRGLWWFFILMGLSGLCWGIWTVNRPDDGTSKVNPTVIHLPETNMKGSPADTSLETEEGRAEFVHDSTNIASKNKDYPSGVIKSDIQSSDRKTIAASSIIQKKNGKQKEKPAYHQQPDLQKEDPIVSASGNKTNEANQSEAIRNNPGTQSSEDSADIQNPNTRASEIASSTDLSQSAIATTPSAIPSDSIAKLTLTDSLQLPADSLGFTPSDTVQKICPRINSWEAMAGMAWSKFNLKSGIAFAASDREATSFISDWSPDFSVRRNFNRFQVGLGYSSFAFKQAISDDSIRVAGGEYVIIEGEIGTEEYYDTDLDEQLRQFSAITNFTSNNVRLQGGFNLLRGLRFQITPHLGIEYQKSKYEELSYYRYGFYSYIVGSDPLADYYDIWHEKRRTTYSHWIVNGLGSIEINAVIWRNFFLAFEPVIHYPLKSNKVDYQKTLRFDTKLSIGFRLQK